MPDASIENFKDHSQTPFYKYDEHGSVTSVNKALLEEQFKHLEETAKKVQNDFFLRKDVPVDIRAIDLVVGHKDSDWLYQKG